MAAEPSPGKEHVITASGRLHNQRVYDPRLNIMVQPPMVNLRRARATLEIREEDLGSCVVYARMPSTRPDIAYELVMLGTVEELREALDVRRT